LTTLVNEILSILQEEIVVLQESFSESPAQDFAEYRYRVGQEQSLKKAKNLVNFAYSRWVKDDGDGDVG